MRILPQTQTNQFISLLSLKNAGLPLTHRLSNEKKEVHFKTIQDIPSQNWVNLANKNVSFGHQSVGYNIIDGLKEVMKRQPDFKLNIVEIETNISQQITTPYFAHFRIGVNQNPKSKIDAFVEQMHKNVSRMADISLFKFCYVDIDHKTHIQNLFSYYRKAMEELVVDYPNTTFIHVTVPLTTQQTGFKAFLKKILGKPLRGDNNIYREQFNELMRTEYAGKEPIFDLALMESTPPERHETQPGLLATYTEDGGHLNDLGSKIIAEQFLIFLADCISQQASNS